MSTKIKRGQWRPYEQYVIAMRMLNLENDAISLYRAISLITDIDEHMVLIPPEAYCVKLSVISNEWGYNNDCAFRAWVKIYEKDIHMMQDVLCTLSRDNPFQSLNFLVCSCNGQHISLRCDDKIVEQGLRRLERKLLKMFDVEKERRISWKLKMGYWKTVPNKTISFKIQQVVRVWAAKRNERIPVQLPRVYYSKRGDHFECIPSLTELKNKNVSD